MRFFDVVLKNVFRRRVRSFLTALSVAVGVGAVTSLVSFAVGLKRAATEVYQNRDVDLVVIRAAVVDRLTSNLYENAQPRLAALPHVAAVAATLTETTSLGEGSLLGIPVHGQRPDEFAIKDLTIIAGRNLANDDTNCVLLGQQLLEMLDKRVGQTVDIESQSFRIVGIFKGVNLMEDATAIVPLTDLQTLMDRAGQVSEFEIRLANDLPDRSAISQQLQTQINGWQDESGKPLGLKATPTQEFVDQATDVRLSNALAWVCSVVALVVGGIGMLNTMLMAVLERTREIGLLRAIGWQRRRVGLLIVFEAQLLSAIGAVLGVLGGWILILALSRSHYSQGLVSPNLSPWVVLWAALLAPAVGLLGGTYPALRASRLQPMEALRYE